MTCPFGSSTVSVAASNNGFGYSAPADVQIIVTDYTVEVSPAAVSLAPGGTSTHVVTITPQGGPYNSEVALSCASGNLPPQTACAFDPPTVVPGSTGARSRLTISTAATSAASLQRTRAAAPVIVPAAVGSGIAVFPAALGFTAQTISTTTPPQFVYVTNSGTGVLALSSITASGDFAGVNNCGTTLAVAASCAVAITFTPTAAGTRTGALTLVDDASGSPHTVALTGTGQAAPASTGGTPSGSYSVTISAAAGTLSHVGAVTLTVQ
jgi:hypothetical protein